MALIWHPDFCNSNPGCKIDIERDWSQPVAFLNYCFRHQAMKTSGSTDLQIFTAILQSSRMKETARYAFKENRNLAKDYPGIPVYQFQAPSGATAPYVVIDLDGNFIITTGLSGNQLTNVRNFIATKLASVSQPLGTSTVTVV